MSVSSVLRSRTTRGAALVGAGCAVAMLATSGTAGAYPMADKFASVQSGSGATVSLLKNIEHIDPYLPMDLTLTSRAAFATVGADVGIVGGPEPSAGKLELGYQVGCNIDVSSGLTFALGSSIGPNVSLKLGVGIPSVSVEPTIGLGMSLTPNISANIKPGTVKDVPLIAQNFTGRHATASLTNTDVRVDGCLGPTTIRSFARVTTVTGNSTDVVNVYGDVAWLV